MDSPVFWILMMLPDTVSGSMVGLDGLFSQAQSVLNAWVTNMWMLFKMLWLTWQAVCWAWRKKGVSDKLLTFQIRACGNILYNVHYVNAATVTVQLTDHVDSFKAMTNDSKINDA